MNSIPSLSGMRTWRTRRALLRTAAAGLGTLLLTGGSAMAQQDWPNRPVKIVIAVAAGSTGDLIARTLGPKLEAIWKQPVIVENRPGAGGIVGTEHVVNATDGHTLILASNSSILPKWTSKSLRFDPLTDLVPVVRVINYQMLVATSAATAQKARTLQDVVALSKSNDKGLFFAGLGPGAIFNLQMAVLNQSLGIKYTAVDFNGTGPMHTAVIRDDAQLVVNTPGALKALFDGGQAVPLVAINDERYPNMPNVPSLTDAGYKGYIPRAWAGFMVPKSFAPAVVEKIARDVQSVLADADTKAQLESRFTGRVTPSGPALFAREIREEADVWKGVFASMNYQPQ